MSKAKLENFKPQQRNANKHTPRGMGVLEKSIQADGWIGAITVAADGETFDGSARIEVGVATGFEDAIVVESDGTRPIIHRRTDIATADDPRARRLGLAANRAAELNLDWDIDELLASVADGVDLSSMFRQDELDALLQAAHGQDEKATGEDKGAQTDRAAELKEQWGTKLSQVWQLGEHRLAVGDCTDRATVEAVMRGEKADMVFTDPPYGVDYEGGLNDVKREKLAGDTSGALYDAFLKSTLWTYRPNTPLYIWFADKGGKPVYDAVEAAGYKVRAMIVWNKLDAHYGNFMAQYMQKHEPCLYCVRDAPPWHGPTNEVTVWDLKQPTKNELHPTQKPVELAERAISNSSIVNAIVADWFLGSGTTLIACEKLNRKARCVELDEGYAAVSIQRWVDMTGKEPRLIT